MNITACPDGYYLEESYLSCVCSQNLLNDGFNCTRDGQLLVPYSSWVGRDQDGVLLFGFCPLDFCRPEISIIPVNSSSTYDMQCNSDYNRGGVACGSCAEGYSVVLGSNRCRKCSNYSLFLLLLFAAYGIVLIIGMIFFQFTISEGYLNGVLFFSNILTVYAPYLLTQEFRHLLVGAFWLSLKFGFEVCFFDGMTALSSAALNFIFPLYLYFLLLMIVLLSRWSSRFSRLLASRECSPIKVFATILVMTYSSLLETCISILAFTTVHEVGTTNQTKASYRWTFDPSVAYFQHYHAALAVFAILLLILFLIPAPFVWMFSGKVYGIARLRPLFDAVWAPLKPKFHFWVSLRLILRIVPLVIISFSPIPLNLLLLSLFLLVLLFVHGMIQPFRGSAQNTLDSLFQVVLIEVTLLALYFTRIDLSLNGQLPDVETALRSNREIMESDAVQVVLVILCVASMYVSFCIVFVWHVMSQFPKLRMLSVRGWNYVMCKRCHVKQLQGTSSKHLRVNSDAPPVAVEGEENEDGEEKSNGTYRTIATFSELREPLLESSGLAEMYGVNDRR